MFRNITSILLSALGHIPYTYIIVLTLITKTFIASLLYRKRPISARQWQYVTFKHAYGAHISDNLIFPAVAWPAISLTGLIGLSILMFGEIQANGFIIATLWPGLVLVPLSLLIFIWSLIDMRQIWQAAKQGIFDTTYPDQFVWPLHTP